jgi:hypothetical protein
VIVIPLPEVEGPDGPEEQQYRARNEDHSSYLEQPCWAPGGLHGDGGVRLRGRRWTGCRATHTRDPCILSRGNREDWSRKPWPQEHSEVALRVSLVLRHGSTIADSSLGRPPSTAPSAPRLWWILCTLTLSPHTGHSHLIPSSPHIQRPKSLIPEVDLAPTGSRGLCVWTYSTAVLGTQEVLTGGLQNSTSSGPTMVIGTLSEFSVMAEDGEVRYAKTLSHCPNCSNCPLVPTTNAPCTTAAAGAAAAATAASCSGQPFCPHPFQHLTSPLPLPSTLEQPTQLILCSQMCPPHHSLPSKNPEGHPDRFEYVRDVEPWNPTSTPSY